MDWLTFLAICIVIIPIQVICLSCLFWFRKKFDKYENIALGVITKYIETNESLPYSTEEVEKLRSMYEIERAEIDPKGCKFPQLDKHASTETIITQYKKINNVACERKRIILESSIDAIVHTIKDKYGSESINESSWTKNEPRQFLRTTVNQMASEIDNNPLISAGLELISGAWVYFANDKKNYCKLSDY